MAGANRNVADRGTGHPDDHGLAKSPPGSLPCYSFGGMFRECQDVLVARRVAKLVPAAPPGDPVGDEFLSRFPHYAERTVYLTDGCTDVNRSPDLYVNERARKIAPVRMTGNYGGEVLRRVRAFKPVEPTPGLFRPEFLSTVRRRSEPTPSCFGATRSPLPFSGRPPGTTMVFSR